MVPTSQTPRDGFTFTFVDLSGSAMTAFQICSVVRIGRRESINAPHFEPGVALLILVPAF